MAYRTDLTAEEMIEAIPGSAGIVSTIARKVGCSWPRARKFIDQHPTVLDAYRAECEKIKDLAETKMIEIISDKDPGTIRWYLSTKARDRGYGEHQDITLHGEVGLIEVERATKSLDTDGRQGPDAPA